MHLLKRRSRRPLRKQVRCTGAVSHVCVAITTVNPPSNDASAPLWLVLLIPVVFPIFFAAIWCSVCLLLSVIGGWGRLANRFPARQPPAGTCFFAQSGQVGLANYRGVLTVHTSPEGLHLAIMKIFRPGHPPLFIPWSEIYHATERRLFFEYVAFDIGSPRIATMRLPKRILAGRSVVTV